MATTSPAIPLFDLRLEQERDAVGSWDRHTGRTDTYDVTELGFNSPLDDEGLDLVLGSIRRALS